MEMADSTLNNIIYEHHIYELIIYIKYNKDKITKYNILKEQEI